MTCITLQFGQCGNQLGEELFSLAFSDSIGSKSLHWHNSCGQDRWFTHTTKNKLKARALLIDSENSVISSINNSVSRLSWSYNLGNVVMVNNGSAANNFAQGYSLIGPQLRDSVLEVLRKECEKSDRIGGFLSLGSCGGGTGSGAGTFLLERVKDSYPNKDLISVLVTPYPTGEVITQNNNTLFAISKQNDICDALVQIENDSILNLIRHRFKDPTFNNMNKIISMNILSFLQPIQTDNSDIYFNDLLYKLCFHPDYKIVTTQSFPLAKQATSKFDTFPAWTTIERDMIRFLKSSFHSPSVDFLNSLSNVIISRGNPVPNSTLSKVRSLFLPADWVPANFAFHHYHSSRQFLDQESIFNVVSNSDRVCSFLDNFISKAWKSFSNGMFVHHYYKFGFEQTDFLEAFAKSEKILKAYRSIQ